MILPFLHTAAVSPTRQKTFRTVLVAHLLAVGLCYFSMVWAGRPGPPVLLGQVLLVAAVVEGALLIGWRMSQLPKSQALEFLLVSPLRPPWVFLGEALVGVAFFSLVTLAEMPFLLVMCLEGLIVPADFLALLLVPWTWGAVTGFALTVWAYEPMFLRSWGEKIVGVGILGYIFVGFLAGEHLPAYLAYLPGNMGPWFLQAFQGFHEYNPFGVMQFAMERSPSWAWPRVLWITEVGFVVLAACLVRGASRLHGHFHDEHYRPILPVRKMLRPAVGDEPLVWWAVKRVTRYSGRINLWLAGGFGLLYAIYTVAGDAWPDWLGRQAFGMFDRMGGIPVLSTALVFLATVPAAFQYGLWDSTTHDRCRRLELLLLTELNGVSYWRAAQEAAWRRGRGYFFVAAILWLAAGFSGKASVEQVTACLAAGLLIWSLYFALGFRSFSRGVEANLLGVTLTLLVPLASFVVWQAGYPAIATCLPAGMLYAGMTAAPTLAWLPGPLVCGALALWITRTSLDRCDNHLRQWYDRHHGVKVMA